MARARLSHSRGHRFDPCCAHFLSLSERRSPCSAKVTASTRLSTIARAIPPHVPKNSSLVRGPADRPRRHRMDRQRVVVRRVARRNAQRNRDPERLRKVHHRGRPLGFHVHHERLVLLETPPRRHVPMAAALPTFGVPVSDLSPGQLPRHLRHAAALDPAGDLRPPHRGRMAVPRSRPPSGAIERGRPLSKVRIRPRWTPARRGVPGMRNDALNVTGRAAIMSRTIRRVHGVRAPIRRF